ncbi:hypothetical protein CBM2589_U30027 [Cupriavidus taiwanensis]|uniref:Uncharacterized protein n=1 Tax=Cupriavidus taiwanensis TaxID=164546 RepID=A0A375CSN7_9BURK|nr:hypothetical protein CBM2589_U30027 [Cupriavidus taiwanensis]
MQPRRLVGLDAFGYVKARTRQPTAGLRFLAALLGIALLMTFFIRIDESGQGAEGELAGRNRQGCRACGTRPDWRAGLVAPAQSALRLAG